jgi:hypothetical protein
MFLYFISFHFYVYSLSCICAQNYFIQRTNSFNSSCTKTKNKFIKQLFCFHLYVEICLQVILYDGCKTSKIITYTVDNKKKTTQKEIRNKLIKKKNNKNTCNNNKNQNKIKLTKKILVQTIDTFICVTCFPVGYRSIGPSVRCSRVELYVLSASLRHVPLI